MFLPLLLPGALVLLHVAHHVHRGRQTHAWASTGGTIDDRQTSPYSFLPDRNAVSYSYAVAGRRYSGRRIAFGTDLAFRLPNPSRTWLARHYLPGAEVQVAFDPGNPQDAVLWRGVSPGTYVIAAVAVSMVIAGLAL